MEVGPNRYNETQFLPGSGCVDTAIWMHHNGRLRSGWRGGWTEIMNVESSIKQVLPTIRTLAPPSQKLYKFDEPDTRELLEKQGRAHKRCTPVDPHHGCASVGRPARTYIQQLCEE